MERDVPGADILTCTIATLLVLHQIDMLANAFFKDDVMGFANLLTLLLWVAAMVLWAVGEAAHLARVFSQKTFFLKSSDSSRFERSTFANAR